MLTLSRPGNNAFDNQMKFSIGKKVGGALYVYRSAIQLTDRIDPGLIAQAEACAGDVEWNVVRIAKGSVSLLLYESFDDAPFPALLASVKVDLASGEVCRTNYRNRTTPPILHRKELLLPPDDPRLPAFRALTAAGEEYGLFRDSNKIGTRQAWEARIAEAGLALRGHRLVPADEEHVDVARHRTAIVRRDLSQPMQLMIRFGVVAPGRSVFLFMAAAKVRMLPHWLLVVSKLSVGIHIMPLMDRADLRTW